MVFSSLNSFLLLWTVCFARKSLFVNFNNNSQHREDCASFALLPFRFIYSSVVITCNLRSSDSFVGSGSGGVAAHFKSIKSKTLNRSNQGDRYAAQHDRWWQHCVAIKIKRLESRMLAHIKIPCIWGLCMCVCEPIHNLSSEFMLCKVGTLITILPVYLRNLLIWLRKFKQNLWRAGIWVWVCLIFCEILRRNFRKALIWVVIVLNRLSFSKTKFFAACY